MSRRQSIARTVRATVWIVALLGHAFVAASGAERAPGPIRDLHYGEVLFHFYQQDEFTALTRLLAAQQAGRIVRHHDEAELLRGALYLSYGQTEQATRIFERLLAEQPEPAMHDRIWHFIGKARYQRGDFAEAEAAFARIGDALPDFLRAENFMLQAQNLMSQSRFDEAIGLLEKERGDAAWQAYARFNLGVALVRLGRQPEGRALLEKVGRLKTGDPELEALRDKANLALGFAWLQRERGGPAREALGRVRLSGLHANKALLGFGWADVLQQNYRRALTPWLELSDRDLLDSAVQEALLAVPYAYSRIGANGSAADHYLAAMAEFARESENLGAAIDRAQSGELIPALLALDEQGIGYWDWELAALPDNDDARYLFHFVANHRFQDGLRNYRDLVALREHLGEWLAKLDAFDSMIETRMQGYAERLPAIERRLEALDSTALVDQQRTLARRLDTIAARRDIAALATAGEAEQWQRLTGLEQNPAWDMPQAADARDKHRLLKGTLLWQLDREYAYRLWLQRRAVDAAAVRLAKARDRESRTERIREDMPIKLQTFRGRIDALQPRIAALTAQIDQVLAGQSRQLEHIVVQELENRRQRLASYRLQARFALASIYDQATVRSAGNEEAPQ